MTISIEIKPYLKYFLLHQYGSEPIPATKNNIIGLIIDPLLEKSPREFLPGLKNEVNSATIEIELVFQHKFQKRKNPDYYFFLSRDSEKQFENCINRIFWDLFFLHMDSRILFCKKHRLSIEYKSLIDEFVSTYNLPEEYCSFEMLKKAYYRHRKVEIKIQV